MRQTIGWSWFGLIWNADLDRLAQLDQTARNLHLPAATNRFYGLQIFGLTFGFWVRAKSSKVKPDF